MNEKPALSGGATNINEKVERRLSRAATEFTIKRTVSFHIKLDYLNRKHELKR